MRLKQLELQGYKTFAVKTNFLFKGGLTAIVGPNGSGKSNVADAIQWVLGEQTYGRLRAKRSEDMIFSGSNERARTLRRFRSRPTRPPGTLCAAAATRAYGAGQ